MNKVWLLHLKTGEVYVTTENEKSSLLEIIGDIFQAFNHYPTKEEQETAIEEYFCNQ